MRAAQAAIPSDAQLAHDENKPVRLHITPLRPELLQVYLAPAVLPLAQNISYHTVETFPEKGFGYLELPQREAQKLTKKLNGTILRGSKVRIEMAKSEKRKAREEADAAKTNADAEGPSKRVKKDKTNKELGVLDGLELPNDRKVKRGWTEPQKKNKKHKKEKTDKKDKDKSRQQKDSKYTKDPEMLFKAKLTPVAATEVARKEKSKEKTKDKKTETKSKNKSKSKPREVVVHEFEKNSKTPSFLKETPVATTKKPAVDYVNGKGWVDEDGNVVEAETGRARQRRALELVDKPTEAQKAWIDGSSTQPSSRTRASKSKKAKLTPPTSPSASEEESSVISSSSEDPSSESEPETSTPAKVTQDEKTPEAPQTSGLEEKEVHPLEALFKRRKPNADATSTPAKKLTPITTSFSFFDNNDKNDDNMEVVEETTENFPTTPFTQKDLEWRGLRSAAPTPDTAAIGRGFSFDWRKNSQEADDDDEEMSDAEAELQLTQNTKANASKNHLPDVAEEDEDEAEAEAGIGTGTGTKEQATEAGEKPESEFRKWFWENRGDLNRAWKKRRRDALKSKRQSENRKMTGSRRVG